MLRRILKGWDFGAAALSAAVGIYFLPANAVKDITTELIAFFSIQSAVILPAMIFTAGILKPDGLELNEAERYHKALKKQMLFWVVLLALDFLAVASLIIGKATGWALIISIPFSETTVNLNHLWPAILYFTGALAVLRTIPFVRGVLSLLDLNSEMAQKAIQRRVKHQTAERRAQISNTKMRLPETYGNIVAEPDSKP